MSDFFPNPAIALAVGVVIGGVMQILIQIPSLMRTGWRFRWIWDLAHPGVRQVARLIGPRLFGIGIVQIDVLVGTQFASHMVEGSVASIGLADRVMELVLGGYAIALSTAMLAAAGPSGGSKPDRRHEEYAQLCDAACSVHHAAGNGGPDPAESADHRGAVRTRKI